MHEQPCLLSKNMFAHSVNSTRPAVIQQLIFINIQYTVFKHVHGKKDDVMRRYIVK